MDTIYVTDSAMQLVSKVNTNFGSTVISVDDTAAEVVAALNTAFGGSGVVTMSAYDTASDFVAALNENFKAYDGGGDEGELGTFTFLHISDTHNCADSIVRCKTLMDGDEDIKATILTGDYSAQNGGYSNILSALQSIGDGILMLNGNHDVYNTFGNNQTNATAFLKTIVTDPSVVWGDSNDVASYWYRDYEISNRCKVRIIGLDSYEYNGMTDSISVFDTIYTQSQVDWLIARLMELRDTDYVIICSHEPVVNATVTDYAYNVEGSMDDDIVALRRYNDFCSSRLWVWDTSLSNGNLLPIIIDAYTNKRSINTVVYNEDSSRKVNYPSRPSVSVVADFTAITPATFLFYLCGHLHGDVCAYHPYYNNQLILCVDLANNNTLGNSSDMRTRSNGITINKVTLDLNSKTTTVERIGNNNTQAYNGFDGIVRSSVTFPFKKGGES